MKNIHEKLNFYRGIREQDGMETLELTVNKNETKKNADIILSSLVEEMMMEIEGGEL